MCSNCKIIVVLSLLFAMFAMGLANAQTSSKLNTPALMDQYKPFADYPEGYQAVGLTDTGEEEVSIILGLGIRSEE